MNWISRCPQSNDYWEKSRNEWKDSYMSGDRENTSKMLIIRRELSAFQWQVWTTNLAPQILKLPPEWLAPNYSDNQWACVHEFISNIANKEAVVNRPESSQHYYIGRAQQNAHFSIFHWMGLTAILSQLLTKSGF